MRPRHVVITPDAEDDLSAIYDRIADASSERVALAYVERVRTHLAGFDLAAERGSLRRDIRPHVRSVGFERRLTIAFTVIGSEVHILRIFYAGQDWTSDF